jgi:hypothetical protein
MAKIGDNQKLFKTVMVRGKLFLMPNQFGGRIVV